jgi:hypothetical protein
MCCLSGLSDETSLWKLEGLALPPALPILRHYFALAFVGLFFVAPVLSLMWLYGCIYAEAHRNSARARRHGEPSSPPLLAPTKPRLVSSLKHRISNASLFRCVFYTLICHLHIPRNHFV